MYNVCYTLALYGLILFWNGASELLQPFNPLLKFILVKTVVFLTFWQVQPMLLMCPAGPLDVGPTLLIIGSTPGCIGTAEPIRMCFTVPAAATMRATHFVCGSLGCARPTCSNRSHPLTLKHSGLVYQPGLGKAMSLQI